ncbi:MAG: sigma-70 family RNA polymerase sigma factor [Acidobacteria bacterium]|nr:sigma-70 family RNA polymerase sigma factor [Acidobacteriota bacterium]
MTVTDTLPLLARARSGDAAALDELVAHHRPLLVRWARGRLPAWARDLADTEDLVQNTLIKTLRNLQGFEPASEVAFQQYLREAVKNAIRDEVRAAMRRPGRAPVDTQHPADTPTPLERVIGAERLARYEGALARLPEEERSAIVARFEFGFTHAELAAMRGKGTPDAARKLLQRAMVHLLEFMRGATSPESQASPDSDPAPSRRSG